MQVLTTSAQSVVSFDMGLPHAGKGMGSRSKRTRKLQGLLLLASRVSLKKLGGGDFSSLVWLVFQG